MDLQEMRISEVIQPSAIDLDLQGIHSKDDVIACLAKKLDEAGLLVDKDLYIQSVYEREDMGSTYMALISQSHGKSLEFVRPGSLSAGVWMVLNTSLRMTKPMSN